ncbi:MAG: hypothetical protein ACRDLO_15385 [Solirubrobacterales bacterium]
MAADQPSEPPRPDVELETNRDQLNKILKQAKEDRELWRKIVTDPRGTLESFGLDPWELVLEGLGLGPSADCGYDTCRATQPCGWTVCGSTTNSCAEFEDELRIRMDQVLDQVRGDEAFRQKLVTDPIPTLESLDFETAHARYIAESWGIGPSGDCGYDTCRATQPCGWTVCGSTTNSCAEFEDDLRDRMELVLGQVRADDGLRTRLLNDPQLTLQDLGFDPADTRYVAEQWGIGPSMDCGKGTCRTTDPCGWTICGKTTESCEPGSGAS